jgi:hypothetical protein
MLGGLLGGMGNALHPHPMEPSHSLRVFMQTAAENDIWAFTHISIVWAFVLLLCGFMALARGIEGGGLPETLADLGRIAAIVGCSVARVSMGVDGFAFKYVADTWAAASPANQEMMFRLWEVTYAINFGMFSLWIAFYLGVTFILFGLAVAFGRPYPRWLGWIAVTGGTGAVIVGMVQLAVGPSVLITSILFTIVASIDVTWMFIMGFLLWRQANGLAARASRASQVAELSASAAPARSS